MTVRRDKILTRGPEKGPGKATLGSVKQSSWKRPGLRARILIILALLVLITIGEGAVGIWYTHRMDTILTGAIGTSVTALQTAEDLEAALLNQRGFVSYYFLDGDTGWLTLLEENRKIFRETLDRAMETERVEENRKLLERITEKYTAYVADKDGVIALYKAGERKKGAELHRTVRGKLFPILDLCDKYKKIHAANIQDLWEKARGEARGLRIAALASMGAAAVLGITLSLVLMLQILGPIRRLAFAAQDPEALPETMNEVLALKHRMDGLIEDVDHTQHELERSRERLLQSEKMALVGKLAAEVAHSIRNPMTSIKLRLYSLERTLDLSQSQKTDLDVVSKELRRLDNIVRNFLDFSRPQKLRMKRIDVSFVVDGALELLQKRLEHHEVNVVRRRSRVLPQVEADPEQLKEVLVNLIVNACESMGKGGSIAVTEEDALAEDIGRAVIVRVADTGPGVPAAIRRRIMEPFFSTKEDGTGLGLAIAARICEEHGGRLEFRTDEGSGATFIITLPVIKEEA
jgi:signal transduction histidine kinase